MEFFNRLPIGIQDFEKLREEDCFFVDKTDLMYKLVQEGDGYLLCRPRYFGKTMLVSMLESYFRGRRDLFEGLAVENMEKDWTCSEVLRIDFSSGEYSSEQALESGLESILSRYENEYGKSEIPLTFGRRFERLIQLAYQKSGKPVVVLVDDYDKPILDVMFSEKESRNRELLEEFYSALNGNDFYLRFVFVTGISKFASLNIFNGTNQLKDISTYSSFSNICGFTEMDVHRLLSTAKGLVSENAKKGRGKKSKAEKKSEEETVTNESESSSELVITNNGGLISADQVFAVLDKWYGGYRFAHDGDMLFNPYSIFNCLDANDEDAFSSGNILHQFWIKTGAPALMIKKLKKMNYDLFNILYGLKVDREELMEYRWNEFDILSLIYQSGYLTRTNDDEGELVQLAMPNAEIAEGMLKGLLSEFSKIGSISKSGIEIESMKKILAQKNVGAFINKFSSALEGMPVVRKADYEYLYKLGFHIISNLVGSDVSSDTNSDVMFTVDDGEGGLIGYIFQLKMDKGLDVDEVTEDAFARIEERDFAGRFEEQEIPCKKIVVVFSSEKGGVAGWSAK